MGKTFLLKPGSDSNWSCIDCTEAIETTAMLAELGAVAKIQPKDKIVLLIPASASHCVAAEVPTQNQQQLSKALPYLVEDEFAAPIETLSITAAGNSQQQPIIAVGVSTASINNWVDQLIRHDLAPSAVSVEALLIPWQVNQLTLIQEPTGYLLRWGAAETSFVDTESLPAYLSMVAKADNQPHSLSCYGHKLPADIQDYPGKNPPEQQSRQDWVKHQSQHWPQHTINPLLASFKQLKSQQAPKRAWYRVAILLVSCASLAVAAKGSEYWRLSQASAELKTTITEHYTQLFPDSAIPLDPSYQIEQLIQSSQFHNQNQAQFSRLLGLVSPVINQNKTTRLRGMDYRSQTLELEFSAANAAALTNLREQIARLGLTTTTGAISGSGEQISGTLQVKP